MIVQDIIVAWPRNCDYPLWRQFIRDNRVRFNEVIVAFTETNYGQDYRQFIRQAMFEDHVQFLDPRPLSSGEDWRNVAVNGALLHSYNAPWIWFTEQDFMVDPGEEYWKIIEAADELGYKAMAWYEGPRMHPASIHIRRDLLNRTSKNYGIIPDKGDHFARLQIELEALQSPVYKIEKHAKHLNGLSHNMTLISRGEAPNYEVEEVKKWLCDSLTVEVPLDDRFVRLAKSAL